MRTMLRGAAVAAACTAGCTGAGGPAASTAAGIGLPITVIEVDEGGPGSVAEAFATSKVIIRAELTSVAGARRIYASGTAQEDPNPTVWEEVGLVFSPVEVLKGPPPAEVVIPWTAYQRSGAEAGARRVGAVEVAGRRLSEEDIGTGYVLFLDRAPTGDLRLVNLSNGLVEVAADGTVTGGGGTGSLGELQGRDLRPVAAEFEHTTVNDLPIWGGPFDTAPAVGLEGVLRRGADGCVYIEATQPQGLVGMCWPTGYPASSEGVLRADGSLIRFGAKISVIGGLTTDPFIPGCTDTPIGTVQAYGVCELPAR